MVVRATYTLLCCGKLLSLFLVIHVGHDVLLSRNQMFCVERTSSNAKGVLLRVATEQLGMTRLG